MATNFYSPPPRKTIVWSSQSPRFLTAAFTAGALFLVTLVAAAQKKEIIWSDKEKPIADQFETLRSLDDASRVRVTKDLALRIRQLPPTPNKLGLAGGLTHMATEGDFGRETLQEVTTTLALALREMPPARRDSGPSRHYIELAQLVRYEHMKAESNDPQYEEAMAKLAAIDEDRKNADFTLSDIEGEEWHKQELHGKVVLINFWATWCAPCRKEMADLQNVFDQYSPRGLIVLSISDEASAKVQPFIEQLGISYPVLLDPGGKVHALYHVEGLPRSFVFDRNGNLVATAIDMRTRGQFLEMLAQAGIK
ncbi:MAG TPA: TlpA disulfide reductase family protein [Candidatus Sulfotelmatobacter sp.]|jgi:peroxiredoxin|nr:TlpA disulfide reductase family protein [Candidatus Sulfotelmatobacter sp.]